MIPRLRITRNFYHPIRPKNYGHRTLVDQFDNIVDGHHAYLSHLLYGTQLDIEEIILSPIFIIPIEKLIFTDNPKTHYLPQDIEEICGKPVIVRKDNGLFVIELGNTRTYNMIRQGYKAVQAQEIV